MNSSKTIIGLLTLGLVTGMLPVRAADPTATDRPTIGLVLGGGGAKGFAHVGVLKVLEENRVPVDYITGTSMGAIVAGLYASGLSPEHIERELLAIDWWELLDDKTPRRDLNFRRKTDDSRYLLDLELGFNNGKLQAPQGLASGQKFNNLMQFLTMGVAAIETRSFDELSIPFRAVATDIATSEAIVLDHGNLAVAMRASMAVPGAFTPVEIDGRVLVDGGLVNNIPVDVVRSMGADIVIAVDLGAMDVKSLQERESSLGDILAMTYQIMKRPAQDAQMANADIRMTPDTSAYSASAFHEVGRIIPLGRAAATAVEKQLQAHALDEEAYLAFLAGHRRRVDQSVMVDQVRLEGNQRVSEGVIRNVITTTPGPLENRNRIKRDLNRIYGLGDFQQVLFTLEPSEGAGHDVVYNLQEKSWGPNFLCFGLRLESDFESNTDWGLLVNYNLTRLNALGAEWWNDLEVGSEHRLLSEFYQPLDYDNYFFVAPSVAYSSELQDLYEGEDRIAEYEIDQFQARFEMGVQFKKYAELRTGLTYINGQADVETGSAVLPDFDGEIVGWTARLGADRLDHPYFPRQGYLLEAEALVAQDGLGSDEEYERMEVAFAQHFSSGEHTFSYGLDLGTTFDGDAPAYTDFLLGGPFSFSGLAPGQLRGPYLTTGSLRYRHRLARLPPSAGGGIYLTFRFDAGNVWEDSSDIDAGDILLGGSAGLGMDTIMGPMYLGGGQAEEGNTQFYFSLGSSF